MSKGESVTCRILTHDGSPIDGAKISITPHIEKDILGFEYGFATTNAEGIGKLNNVLDGQVLVLSVEGGFETQILWKKDDEFTESEKSEASRVCVFGKDFEYRLPKMYKTEWVAISGSDGRPVEIQKAEFSFGSLEQPIQYGAPRTEITNISDNRIVFGALRKGVNRIRIYPKCENLHGVECTHVSHDPPAPLECLAHQSCGPC